MKIMVTGAKGMIGSYLTESLLANGYDVVGVDRSGEETRSENYVHIPADLSDAKKIRSIVETEQVDRVIHLAALAHTEGEEDLSWKKYRQANVVCSANVFKAAGDRPVLFISTVDVYGFTKGRVTPRTETKPVSFYAKSKRMAERLCEKLPKYNIYRFSPVYTDTVKRDIQKRYYLRYPDIAYMIGKGTEYEVLNVKNAVQAMVNWCGMYPTNTIRIIKDPNRLNTADVLEKERSEGRAAHVLRFPEGMVNFGYVVLKGITGENKYTYLLNKAVHPLRSSR